ncbi:thiolase-like protein [Lasiosphaeria miniovina]|uniref:Thiolase-like protein n=1 Tax=Lasiosphaeria miniovina TaxID=1954250 RepID=A0AA40ED70_9PEZI|nr:thiolase-like protein [Lasiosphaeria miniovina]KAK0733101.1 thiolase-like protein [Lasiosphaeria miniovina]
MDPQQRWELEAAYHAFENAGIPLESVRGSRTAVYAASMSNDMSSVFAKDPDASPRMAMTGSTAPILANRVSWYFNLRGPSVHVDTAFDMRANWNARGEGVVALLIKPLADVLRHGDVVRAVLRPTASNQDDRTPGLTQTSADAQGALMRHVYAKAGLSFAETRGKRRGKGKGK